jgi:acyl-CoA thioester hydrolase
MTELRFAHKIEVRYGDLDPQGHVNNAKYLTYLEQTRALYLAELELWDKGSFLDIGIILAEARITFLAPIQFGPPVLVKGGVTRIGNKSMSMDYQISDQEETKLYATGSAVLVAYDYRAGASIPVPDSWRRVIERYEEKDFSG